MLIKNFNNTFFYKSISYINRNEICKNIEIAFFGSSNVGKSTLINIITENNKLSIISKKPGSTTMINLFKVLNNFFLVDLPGYGYSKKSKLQKNICNKLIFDYVNYRKQLIGLVFLMDIRNPLKKNDKIFLNIIIKKKIPFVILLTKADKLSFEEIKKKNIYVKKYFLNIKKIKNKIIIFFCNKENIILLRKKILSWFNFIFF
ncbi:ribosome biogenesis GTP-binding protein YihA/YsxC [Buchnera aphidicola]|uniref:ribosome biogenesis GTP-binding protein YihA/YsxC n=1 Tax=Buchnera aphidicola TaxID=9 RepID=UPI0031B84912